MDVVPTQVSFEDLALLLPSQNMQILAKIPAQLPIENLPSVFRYPNHVILAIPLRVT